MSLILASDVGVYKFWSNVIDIFAKHYKADRITLTIPHDLTDVRNTPWGLKASWNMFGLPEDVVVSKRGDQSSDGHLAEEWETMEEYQVVTPGSVVVDEPFWSVQENRDGVVYNQLQHLEIENSPLLEANSVHRVLERGGSVVVLNREYQNLHGQLQTSDMTPGGTMLNADTPIVTPLAPVARAPPQQLRDPLKDEDAAPTQAAYDPTRLGPRQARLRHNLDFEEYEQAVSSPWSQSPAPSPAIQHNADHNPFFNANMGSVDEGAFSPNSDEGTVAYDGQQMFEAIGMESALSVIHIPLVHPSTARAIATSGFHEAKGQVPVGILSFESKVVPYPANLVESVTALAPFIATAMSAALSHSNILHQLAYDGADRPNVSTVRLNTGETSPSVQSGPYSPAFGSIDATISSALRVESNNGESSLRYDSSAVPSSDATESRRASAASMYSDEAAEDVAGRTTSPPGPRRPNLSDRRLLSAPDVIDRDHSSRSSSGRRRSRIPSRALLHSLGANLQSSFRPARSQPGGPEDQIETEVLLQPSSRLIRVIVDAIPVCVYTASPVTGLITWVNERTLAYTGLTAARFLKRSWDSLHPDDRSAYQSGWEAAMQAGEGYSTQTRMRRFDGAYRWFMCRIVPLRDSKGAIVHWFGTMMDIHEQKEAERDAARRAETAASESKYRSLAEASPQIVFAANSDVGIAYANTQWAKFSGQSAEDACGLGFLSYVHPEDRKLCAMPRSNVPHEENDAITRELRLLDRTGDYKWHLIKCVCVAKRSRTEPETWLGTCTDINEHKLLETKLQEARDAATRSAQSKASFLANSSHELRTPMIGIIGMVNFLLDTNLTAEQLDYAHTIQQSAEALLSVINDILDLSKVEAAQMKLVKESFDPRSMVEDAMELLSSMAMSKGLELNFVVEQDVPTALIGDRIRLRQIALNICGNAIKFTSTGEIFTRCYVVTNPSLEADEVEVAWETVDTGPGFTADEEKSIFKPFSQLDASLTRRHGGTGLGLVISRQLAELHGGSLYCTSTKGVGSTFTFTARFKIAPEALPAYEATRARKASSGQVVASPLNEGPVDRFDVLILSHTLYSIVSLDHHIRLILPPKAQANIVTTDKLPAAIASVSKSRETYTHIIVNLPDTAQMLDLLAAVHAATADASTLPHFILITTPVERNAIKDAAAARSIALPDEKVHFAFKIIKPSKLATYFQAGMMRTDQPARHVVSSSAAAQQTVATQKAVFSTMTSSVGQQGFRVLLVEDNPVNQKVMSKFCVKIGLGVDVVGDGQQCLDRLDASPGVYSLILMDLHMPVLDGYETCTRIRALEREAREAAPEGKKDAVRRMPIIALSANVLSDVAERCAAAEFDQYLSKPVSFSQLATRISELLPNAVVTNQAK